MPPDDLDDFAGIPMGSPHRAFRDLSAAPRTSTTEAEGRNAADEAIPLGNPTSVTVVAPEAQRRRDAESQAQQAQQTDQALVMGQSYFAGEIEEHSEEIASGLTSGITSLVGAAALETVPVLGKIAGNAAGKAVQGITHYLLVNRIGRNACKLLRPLSPA